APVQEEIMSSDSSAIVSHPLQSLELRPKLERE
ncbi:MAG: hypothetical protein ACI9OD_004912, partial [Limisphaerales bacterium]